ncbi:MAG: NADH-plastoquinone oxidoreductase subunit [Thermoprotei archaeon]|nr:MAG: NADH-plastoquinone oxidoreductase subunit [Thermoprotei archaeon]RLE56834.1 MAG: NADH-plastoquinone oxidoreductase subunit [Thermoprotei archaeon]
MRLPAIIKETFSNLFRKPATVKVPIEEKLPPAPGYRGVPRVDYSKCTGCGLCARYCPSFAIELITKDKRRYPVFHIYRCIFCHQCVEVCPVKAIKPTEEYELSTDRPSDLIIKP